jgi:hypothetical protein
MGEEMDDNKDDIRIMVMVSLGVALVLSILALSVKVMIWGHS